MNIPKLKIVKNGVKVALNTNASQFTFSNNGRIVNLFKGEVRLIETTSTLEKLLEKGTLKIVN